MGLLAELGYEVHRANAVQRAMQRVASSRLGAWVFSRTLHPLDRLVFRLTNGRRTVPGILAGLPVLMVTTTGAKSGLERTMPLVGIPIDDDVAIIGSNFGQAHTPGWVFNLRVDPTATVAHRDREVRATARRATPDEEARVWARAGEVYPGYRKYRERAAHREIEVWVLVPAAATS